MCVSAAVRAVAAALSEQLIRALPDRKPRLLTATLPPLPALPPPDTRQAGRAANHAGGERTRPQTLQRRYII